MIWLEIELRAQSAFGTDLRGVTLFGQFCAEIASVPGGRLDDLLQGYDSGQPFAVFGDARPSGMLPRPTLPMHIFKPVDGVAAKELKSRIWTPIERARLPIENWLKYSLTDLDIGRRLGASHRSRNDLTQVRRSVGRESPRAATEIWSNEIWFDASLPLVVDLLIDTKRLTVSEALDVLQRVGWKGYGRGASRGLGKFLINSCNDFPGFPMRSGSSAWLSMGSLAPGQMMRNHLIHSFYKSYVHHGRHGPVLDADSRIHNAFVKAPVVLAEVGGIFCLPKQSVPLQFWGCGLGGAGRLSRGEPRTVLQGYAPVLPVRYTGFERSVSHD